jgi:hypothetical protein
MVVAQYHLRMRDVLSPDGVPVGDAVCAGVIAELERRGDPLSHSILRGLEYVGVGETAQRSRHAVARLTGEGLELPAEFADVATSHAVGAWRATVGGRRDEYALFVEFEHPLGARHSIALFVEPRRGGTVKHIGLMGSMEELDADDPFHPSGMETVEIDAAGALMRELLERSFGSSLADTDDFRVLIGAARARAMEREGVTAGR